MNTNKCSACGSTNVREILQINDVPAHCCLLWEEKEEAINCPKGDIYLNFCNNCGHLYNQVFDPELMAYTQDYENSLHFSPKFQKYSQDLVKRLTETYQIINKDIIEIGCGKGDFLKMICEYGKNKGYGFDKSYEPKIDSGVNLESVEFIQDFYSEKYSSYPADFIITRYVLEHIQDPGAFIGEIKSIIDSKKRIIFYFEVPNILYTLRDQGIWDLIYEHCSYFSAPSLTSIFENLGFEVKNVSENYLGQFLSIEASTHRNTSENYKPYISIEEVSSLVENFSASFNHKISEWQNKLNNYRSKGKKVVAWGGGAKGVSFLNFLKTEGFIHEIVDINPRKQDMYIAGTGQKYILPEQLVTLSPDVVILMNPIYEKEISNTLKELNLSPEVLIA